MTLKQLKEEIQEAYWKNKQNLHFESLYEYNEVQKRDDFDEIHIKEMCDNKNCCLDILIQTFKRLDSVEISSTPYCIRPEGYNYFQITVPRFDDLTVYDIAKAIRYILREVLDCYLLFNIYFEDKSISSILNNRSEKCIENQNR